MSKDNVSRRDFLRGTLAAGAGVVGGSLLGCKSAGSEDAVGAEPEPKVAQAPAGPAAPNTTEKSRVIHLNSANAFDLQTGQADYQAVKNMVQTGICYLTGDADPIQAWQRFVGPNDRVGLKINCLGRPSFFNDVTLLRVLKEQLTAIGVPAESIIVFDRYYSHLVACGFTIGQQADGSWVLATESRAAQNRPGRPGYDDSVTQSFHPAGGKPAESAPCSNIVTQQVTKLINIPILKTHGSAGVTLALKNLAFGVFRHTKSAHNGKCDPYIPAMCSNAVLRQKTVLTILDGLKGQYDGGPAGKPQFQWAQGSIWLGTDPVAIDFLGAQVINQVRQQHGKGPIRNDHMKHIFTAAQMGIGHASEAQIEEVAVPV